MNIDVAGNQFDVDRMLEDASKLGLDVEDLEEFGFDVRNNNCGGSGCRSETFEEFSKKFDLFKKVVQRNITAQWERMKCHPMIAKHVVPRVEQIWHCVPLNIILGPFVTTVLDIASIPLWIVTCWAWLIVLPWN